MKKTAATIIFFLLLLAWMANLFTEFTFRPQIFYGLTALLFINQLLQIRSIATKQIPADLAIRKAHYRFNFWALGLAILWTLLAYFNGSDRIYLAILFWTLFLATAIGHLVYSRKKPYTLLLQGATLIQNSLWLRKRNLDRLKRITYDDHEDEIYFYFEGQSKLLIEPKSYEDQDLFPFIKEMIARSGKEVELSGNLKMLLGRY